jgi:hypothetical protein
MIDVATSNELDDALRHIDHVFNAISLLGEAETTPPRTISGLADVGGALAKAALERYLALRPNLKTRNDYRRIFIRNSALAGPIIEGFVKAGWEPER